MIDQNTKIIISYQELEFHDKQIRADAIDEFARKMALNIAKCQDGTSIYEILDNTAEQLKEQNKE